jgi:molybdate transport system substrate-binding protein
MSFWRRTAGVAGASWPTASPTVIPASPTPWEAWSSGWPRRPPPRTASWQGLLNVPTVQRIALANPRLAPYGAAAVQALQRSGLDPELGGRAVLGSSVGQTWQFAASGHVQAAFLALSQVIGQDRGWHMVVPADLHEPIRQDAVLLKSARDEPAARAFLRFLRSEAAGKIMTKFGYRKGDGDP